MAPTQRPHPKDVLQVVERIPSSGLLTNRPYEKELEQRKTVDG